MAKLIASQRKLGLVRRKLVTDAGGAPCCCGGGVCCPPDNPCNATPIRVCNGAGQLVDGLCPPNKGSKLSIVQTWRSTALVRDLVVRNGYYVPRVTRWQFALEASGDFCFSSSAIGDEWRIGRAVASSLRLQGVTFQSTTIGGQSVFDYAAGGAVEVLEAPVSSLLLPEISSPGTITPASVELLRPSPFPYTGIPSGATATTPSLGSPPQPIVISGPAFSLADPCTGTRSRSSTTTESWDYADACDGGRFAWTTTTAYTRGPDRELQYTASLESVWRRTFCACPGDGGGGTQPQARGGGCASCGDASSLEVIG